MTRKPTRPIKIHLQKTLNLTYCGRFITHENRKELKKRRIFNQTCRAEHVKQSREGVTCRACLYNAGDGPNQKDPT